MAADDCGLKEYEDEREKEVGLELVTLDHARSDPKQAENTSPGPSGCHAPRGRLASPCQGLQHSVCSASASATASIAEGGCCYVLREGGVVGMLGLTSMACLVLSPWSTTASLRPTIYKYPTSSTIQSWAEAAVQCPIHVTTPFPPPPAPACL